MALFPDLPPLASAVLALGIVLALVWLAGRVAPRLMETRLLGPRLGAAMRTGARAPGRPRLARLETLPLGPRHRLHLVRCDGRDVVLLTGGPQDVVVGWLPSGDAEGGG